MRDEGSRYAEHTFERKDYRQTAQDELDEVVEAARENAVAAIEQADIEVRPYEDVDEFLSEEGWMYIERQEGREVPETVEDVCETWLDLLQARTSIGMELDNVRDAHAYATCADNAAITLERYE